MRVFAAINERIERKAPEESERAFAGMLAKASMRGAPD
jgi:hypothetical protein